MIWRWPIIFSLILSLAPFRVVSAGGVSGAVEITNSRDPVLRGEWLLPGALVCAAGANWSEARELDNAVLERATFVCCDSLEQAPVARSLLFAAVGLVAALWALGSLLT